MRGNNELVKVILSFISAFFLMSCSSCALLNTEGFMIHRKRNSVGIISSHTFLKITTRLPPIDTSTTATGSITFSTFYSGSGSGAIVKHNKKTSFILTAAHVCTLAFDQQIKQIFPFFNRYKYKVKFSHLSEIYDVTGKKYPAVPLVWSKKHDTCIMVVPKIDQPSLDLAFSPPYTGEKVYYMGFPRGIGGGKFVPAFEGYYLGMMSVKMGNRGGVAGYSVPIAPGSSGSSILNIHGDIIGMIHSYYPSFGHIGLSATHRQLKMLFEEADDAFESRKKYIYDELEAWL
jgi:S1-C subfamily serine protease